MIESLCGENNPPPVALGTGLIALDVIMTPDNSEIMWTGGSCGNVLTILNWLGWRSYPIANLGDDEFAEIIYDDLSYWKIELKFIIRNENGRTPIIIEKLKSNGVHKFMFKCPIRGTNLPRYKPISAKDIDINILKRDLTPSVFYFDRVSKSALALAQELSSRGTVVVFEPCSIRNKRLFKEALRVCHILKYSREQSQILEKVDSGNNPFLEIETLGQGGLRYQVNSGSLKQSWKTMGAFRLTHVVDTAGAGDWCTAGIVHYLCQREPEKFRKLSIEDIESGLRLGQAFAALNCMFEGARGGMYLLSRDEFENLVNEVLQYKDCQDIVEKVSSKFGNEMKIPHSIANRISYINLVE